MFGRFWDGARSVRGRARQGQGLAPGCAGITEARAELVRRGVEISEIRDFDGGVKGADFSDPDGNTFELQQMSWRKGARYQELADCAPVGCRMNVPAVDFNR